MKKHFIFKLLCLGVWVTSMAASAQPKGKDHPLMSGPSGYSIDGDIVVKDYGGLTEGVLNKFSCENDNPCADSVPGFKGGKLAVEGKYTQIRYTSNKPAGDLAILRSYENAFKQIGGRKLTGRSDAYGTHLFFIEKDKKRTWMALDNGDSFVYLTFLEEKAADQLVTAGQLADSISRQGFATLYINFDNNKFNIKPDAQPSLGEVAKLLTADKDLRISVEGHTDNVGKTATNKTLSSDRANSVMKFLVAAGIDAKRLQSKGFGSEAPVADNRGEEGRAKNRRVEIVKIK